MIYSHSLSPVYCVEYETFCHLMEIHYGTNSASWRSPAEARTVAAFQYAVNSGRGGVFVNWNRDITIVVPQSARRSMAWNDRKGNLRSNRRHASLEWALISHLFDSSKYDVSPPSEGAIAFLKSNGVVDE